MSSRHSIAAPPETSSGMAALRAKAGAENFPVASFLLPPRYRRHLMAVYVFARLVDDIGDEYSGDRTLTLDAVTEQLDLLFSGEEPTEDSFSACSGAWREADHVARACPSASAHSQHRRPAAVIDRLRRPRLSERLTARDCVQEQPLRQLAETVRACALEREPFDRLVEANRQDQVVARYTTFEQLEDYCALSANPVGALVLGVFGADRTDRRRNSDRVCTALQLLEHSQDVAQDYAAGRVYLPTEDLERFGVTEAEFADTYASRNLRALIGYQVQRATRLLEQGAELLGTLSGPARVAVAGYVGGGFATAEMLARAGFDVLGSAPQASKAAMAIETARLLKSGSMR